jgi:hypothetical protein
MNNSERLNTEALETTPIDDKQQKFSNSIFTRRNIIIGSICLCILLILGTCFIIYIQDTKAVNDVISKINDVGNDTLDIEETISIANTAYENLSDKQKKKITNYSYLTTAINEYNVDKKAADDVSALIEQIKKIKLAQENTEFTNAKSSYENLTENQKKLVKNYDKLKAAENEYQEKLDEMSYVSAMSILHSYVNSGMQYMTNGDFNILFVEKATESKNTLDNLTCPEAWTDVHDKLINATTSYLLWYAKLSYTAHSSSDVLAYFASNSDEQNTFVQVAQDLQDVQKEIDKYIESNNTSQD